MLSGAVSDDLEASVRLRVAGPRGLEKAVDAVIDTGFSGGLMLPASLVESLGLRPAGHARAQLADGSFVTVRKFAASAGWGGVLRAATVYESEGGVLVGMDLLRGHQLCVDVEPRGAVKITPLESARA